MRSARLTLSLCVALLALGACTPAPGNDLTGLQAGNHVWFPVGDGNIHALNRQTFDGTVSCASCHAAAESFTVFSCVSCHEHRRSGVDADGSDGMDAVHAGNGDYVYRSAACLRCHPNGESGEISRQEHTFFPITPEATHGILSCSECHTSAARSQFTCTGCHRDTDGDMLTDHDVAPMLAVHGSGMVNLGYAWDTASCIRCHAQAQVPGTINHDPVFPIGQGTLHGDLGVRCADCHQDPQNRRLLGCVDCHTPVDGQDAHGEAPMLAAHQNGTVPGYVWESNACYACHQRSQVPGVMEHDRFFPIGAGAIHQVGIQLDDDPNDAFPAETVECASCHQDPQQQRNVTCTSCHAHQQDVMQPTHGLFPDYAWDSASCVFCHLGGQKRLNHTFFPVAQGQTHALDNPNTTQLDGLRCSECHLSKLDRRQLACISCHRHDAAQSIDDHGPDMSRHGYSYDSGACFNCHQTSQVPGAFDHQPIWPLLPPSGDGHHQALQCGDCHASKADRLGSLQCTSCHLPTSDTDSRDVHGEPRMEEVHANMPGYFWTSRSCVACHTDGTADSALANLNHTWFPIATGNTHAITTNGGDLSCADCHTQPGDYSRATIGCITCHSQVNDGAGPQDVHGEPRLNAIHAGVDSYTWASPACLDCHPNGEPSANIAHNQFPIGTGSAHGTVGCTSCHGSGARNDPNNLQCAQCHNTQVNTNPTSDQIHNGITNYANNSPACYRCHPNSEPVGPFNHAAFFPIGAGTAHGSANYMAQVVSGKTQCSACHASRTDRTQNTCRECHATVPTNIVSRPSSAHTRVRDYVDANPDCKACHAEGTTPAISRHSAFPTSHEGSTCRECHGDVTACLASSTCYGQAGSGSTRNTAVHTAMRTDKPWAVDWTVYACLKCHKHKKATEDNRHSGRSNYRSYANPGCAQCH